jgi:hypothetical protein
MAGIPSASGGKRRRLPRSSDVDKLSFSYATELLAGALPTQAKERLEWATGRMQIARVERTLLSAAVDVGFVGVPKININTNPNGGGQECPPYAIVLG